MSEEADQRLIHHTLHCISDLAQYKRIVVCTINTNVLNLVILYVSEYCKLCRDNGINADMMKSVVQSGIICTIRALDKEICN